MNQFSMNELLRELIEQGREIGYLTYEEIHRHIPDSNINVEDLDQLYTRLQEMGIRVIKKSEANALTERQRGIGPIAEPAYIEEAEVTPEPVELEVDTQNSIRMYLTEMGKVPPLTERSRNQPC